ncbi:DNA cytosine methyltransferase [Pseudomonas tohonis]|nr:hypothetical protein L682_11160 [Pseudomonas alcaligenes OT 69]MDN4148732.1 DNA cytosine methyltransferase [Pseudomonas tohonis]
MSAYQKFPTTLPLPLGHELFVDLFAGHGGASEGGRRAYRDPDIAINHNPVALAVHRANHPSTRHYRTDVFEVDPIAVTGGQPVGILWASPDCRHFSRAKGGKPRQLNIRSLAWVVVRWVYATRPRLFLLENVEEFRKWGPLDADGYPIKALEGRTFDAFVAVLTTGLAEDHPDMPEILDAVGQWVPKEAIVRGMGCKVEHQLRIAANVGARTSRKRLFMIGRTDGRPIVWPEPAYHKAPKNKQKAWRPVAECLDFTDLGRSIIDKEPVANTCKRVAKGIWRHVMNTGEPFIVPLRGTTEAHHTSHETGHPISTIAAQGRHHALLTPHIAPVLTEFANTSSQRTFSATEPMRTQVAQVKGGHFAMAAPTLIQTGYGEREGQEPRAPGIGKPLGTVVAGGTKHALVAASMVTLRKGSIGASVNSPLSVISTSGGHHALAACCMEQANGGFYDGDGRPLTAPASTITQAGSNQRLVSAFLVKYHTTGDNNLSLQQPVSTLTTRDRLAMVTTEQVPADLLPPELMEKARKCAAFMHRHLPTHFPHQVDLILMEGWVLVDITMRMLKPRELASAQGFGPDYIIDRGLFENEETGELFWKGISQKDQVAGIGNSVCPDEAEALIGANARDMIDQYRRLAA